MKDKRTQIIEAAVKCFAQKGYHATSIQEIADTAGIAKGSLYFYFDSKEALLLSAFQYHYELMVLHIEKVMEDHGLSPRERLTLLIQAQYEQLLEHRDFILMFMSEQTVQINDEMKRFIFRVRAQTLFRTRNQIVDLYGDEAREYALDAAALLQAMASEFMHGLLWGQKELNLRSLAQFLIARTDDLVYGMVRRKLQPIYGSQDWDNVVQLADQQPDRPATALTKAVGRLRITAESLPGLDEERKAELMATLQVLEEEAGKRQPHAVLLKALAAYMRGFGIERLERQLAELEACIK